MNYKKVLDKLPNMYIVITDKQDKIVYPKNKKKLKLIKKIYKGFKKEKGYCKYKDSYYEIIKKEHIKNNKIYNLMYLKNITLWASIYIISIVIWFLSLKIAEGIMLKKEF